VAEISKDKMRTFLGFVTRRKIRERNSSGYGALGNPKEGPGSGETRARIYGEENWKVLDGWESK